MFFTNNKRKKNLGFSLAEILVTLTIVSVGSIGAGKLYTSMITETSESKLRFEAATLAEAKLESLRFSHKIGDTAAMQMTIDPTLHQGEEHGDRIESTHGTFILSWTTESANKGQSNLSTTVKWKDRNGEYTDATSITLSAVSSEIQASISAPLSAKPDPVFDVVTDLCDTNKDTLSGLHGGSGWSTFGAYGSTETSATSCGSGNADTGSS